MDWNELIKLARSKLTGLDVEYKLRLDFEDKEINKQGANEYWIDLYESGAKFDTNKNGLVFPFLLGITSIDPIKGVNKILCGNGSNTDITINGVEIELDNGKIITLSKDTLIETENRGFIRAQELSLEDSLVYLD